MKKKSRKKWVILSCVAVVVIAAVLVGFFVGKPLLRQREFEQHRKAQMELRHIEASEPLSFYDEKTPLSQVDPNELARVLPQAMAPIGYEQPENARFLELPEDLHYYSQPDASGEPAATIPKGTVVTLYESSAGFFDSQMGYGLGCYPDYQKGWRYGQMFVTEAKEGDAFYQALEDCPYYYVQTKELETIAAAFYDLHKEDVGYLGQFHGKDDFVYRCVRLIDQYLYNDGYFFSPDFS